MRKSKYTKEILEPIVKECTSIAQVLKKLGLQYTGGNYTHISKKIKEYDIDRSHFLGQGHLKGKHSLNRRPTSDYLDNKYHIHSHKLKLRLLDEKYFDYECQKCKNIKWFGEPIPLELHHIDKNHNNNNLENLMILCPNCHSFLHKS